MPQGGVAMIDTGVEGKLCVTLETATLERDGFVLMRSSFVMASRITVGCHPVTSLHPCTSMHVFCRSIEHHSYLQPTTVSPNLLKRGFCWSRGVLGKMLADKMSENVNEHLIATLKAVEEGTLHPEEAFGAIAPPAKMVCSDLCDRRLRALHSCIPRWCMVRY